MCETSQLFSITVKTMTIRVKLLDFRRLYVLRLGAIRNRYTYLPTFVFHILAHIVLFLLAMLFTRPLHHVSFVKSIYREVVFVTQTCILRNQFTHLMPSQLFNGQHKTAYAMSTKNNNIYSKWPQWQSLITYDRSTMTNFLISYVHMSFSDNHVLVEVTRRKHKYSSPISQLLPPPTPICLTICCGVHKPTMWYIHNIIMHVHVVPRI